MYKIYEVTADDGFVMYTVVDAANDMVIETFYTLWDAEEFIASETV